MQQPIIQRSYLTEIKLTIAPANNQRIQFLDIPELGTKNARIIGIQCFNNSILTMSPNGNPVLPNINGIIVTFAEASTETVYQYPCQDLLPSANSGLIRVFNKKAINIPKSYITILDATTVVQYDSILFNFLYESIATSTFRQPGNQNARK